MDEEKREVMNKKHFPSQRSVKAFLCGFLCCAVLSGAIAFSMKMFFGKEAEIRRLIADAYLEEVPYDVIEEGKYRGMVDAIGDKYSAYYTKDEYEATRQTNRGTYTGIGIVFTTMEDGSIFIADLYPGAPGERAGFKIGDKVVDIDGVKPPELSITEVAESLRSGTRKSVTLTVTREGEEEPFSATLKPEEVDLRTVAWSLLEDGTGYIRITNFRDTTVTHFKEAYSELQEQGMKRLVFDLRGNGGGMVNAVTDILDSFMPEGLLVYTVEKDGKKKEYNSAGKTPADVPVAVLVNGSTASSAEIFAGAVKDREVGIIVGETTFGKGIVQTYFTLSDNSGVKLTTANYYTPNGTNLNGTGITPDIEVALPEGAFADLGETDAQYQAALAALKEKE